MLYDDNINLYCEGFHLKKSFSKNNSSKEDAEELKENLTEIKENLEQMEIAQVYKENRTIFNFIKDLLKNWLKYGLIGGVYVIPFTITLFIIKIYMRKLAKSIKTEADKRMYVDYVKLEVTYLTSIKSNNKKLGNKINKTIDTLNNLADKTVNKE
jgi:hypothetical protein